MSELTLVVDETIAAAVIEALNALDPANDAHWTDEGLPEVDDIAALSGVPATREDLNRLANGFSRQWAADGWCVKALAAEGGEATLQLRPGLTAPIPSGQADPAPAEDTPRAAPAKGARPHAQDESFQRDLSGYCHEIDQLMQNRRGLTGAMQELHAAAVKMKRELADG